MNQGAEYYAGSANTGIAGVCTYRQAVLGRYMPGKSCCESKSLEHCGKCKGFPCDLLSQFAYDKEQGDDGKRIRQCRTWAMCK